MSPGGFAHPGEVATAFLDGHVKVDARQFLAEGTDMKVALDLPKSGELLLRPTGLR